MANSMQRLQIFQNRKGKINMTNKKVSFEEAIKQLEGIVEKLEKNDLPLDECVKEFKNGLELSKLCDNALKEAQEMISVLTQSENGEIQEEKITEKELRE